MHNHLTQDPIYLARAVGVYFLALITVRLMGKRSIGELGAFDFVLMTGIGHIMSAVALERKIPFHDGILVLVTIALLEIVLAIFSYKSRKFGKLIEGKPRYLIRDGKILKENMRKEKFNLYDLRQELRKLGVDNEKEVKKAIIEACGKFSVILKEEEEPIKRKDLGVFKEDDRPQYIDKKFYEIRSEIDRLNTTLNNLCIEVRKLRNGE
ncbi:DUF421 domain-containing protein [Clostridium sp. D2Q-11]|uniref:DUF421 domain-containing protein n=1 Tax=Anaeromonas frigoriresistens TaxID=2683708 RepID=A0A942Z871_9FIRM|nr:YetF domain-containing protein [Anaeromonas frigoriresistens]MBS4537983.1 DUF421 domain-containing protein [Anaeromonas frigoriresistens]